MARKSFTAQNAPAVGPYSHAVEADPFVYVSGQGPVDASTGRVVQGSVADETRQTFKNIAAVLSAAGLTFDDVVKCNVYLTNMADFAEMNQVYAEQFSKPYPARTTVGVASLPMGIRVEIEVIARRP